MSRSLRKEKVGLLPTTTDYTNTWMITSMLVIRHKLYLTSVIFLPAKH